MIKTISFYYQEAGHEVEFVRGNRRELTNYFKKRGWEIPERFEKASQLVDSEEKPIAIIFLDGTNREEDNLFIRRTLRQLDVNQLVVNVLAY